MPISLEMFNASEHTHQTVEVLQRVRIADPTYPPADAGFTSDDLRAWLLEEPGLARWVAISDNEVVGHVQLTSPHTYLTDHLKTFGYAAHASNGFAEIAKLFADPLVRHRGIGTRLLTQAREGSWQFDRHPALAVVSTSSAATRMYAREGMIEAGCFNGIHGINRVMVDPGPES